MVKTKELVIGAVAIGAILLATGTVKMPQSLAGGEEPSSPGADFAQNLGSCPSDGDTSATLDLINGEDEAAGTFNAAGYFLKDGKQVIAVTDTTAGTATLNCGETYVFKLVASDSDQGDNSKITSVSVSGGSAHVVDGGIEVTPTSANMKINMIGSKHGVLEARLFSNSNNAYFYDTGDASNSSRNSAGFLTPSNAGHCPLPDCYAGVLEGVIANPWSL